MLVRVSGVLGVVHWRGNRRQFWGIGGGALALGRHRLRISEDFAGWRWDGHVGGVMLMGHRWWHVGGTGALSQHWRRCASVGGGGTRQSSRGGRGEEGGGSVTEGAGAVVVVRGGVHNNHQ